LAEPSAASPVGPWVEVEPLRRRGISWWARWLRSERQVVSVGPSGLSWWNPEGWTCRRRLLPEGKSRLAGQIGNCGLGAEGTLVLLHQRRLVRLASGAMSAELSVDGLSRGVDGIEVSSDGKHVAVVSDVGFHQGEVDVYDLVRGERRWSHSGVTEVAFSPDGAALLWSFDLPQQAGSDVLAYGVRETSTGAVLGSWRTTCWMESACWGAGSRRVLYGNLGERPTAVHALRGSKSRLKGELVGVHPVPRPPPAVRGWDALEAQMERARSSGRG